MTTYALDVDNGRRRGPDSKSIPEATRLAQHIAYTEGREVEVFARPSLKTVALVDSDSPRPDPPLTISEIVSITETNDLMELLHDAESEHEMQWTRVKTIIDELSRRAVMNRDLSPTAYAQRMAHAERRGSRRTAWRGTLAACTLIAVALGISRVPSDPPTQREQIQQVVDRFASRHVPNLLLDCRADVCMAYNYRASVALVVAKTDGKWVVRSGVA